ncbi:hypothetical protein B0T16DRAFT_451308 [Cercophora newfieldiana]|uniref:Uncharacterized protein n=1 Tax=Cercophora newfieldiana TaxID=92897 RepID=A0AA39YQU0_9PEZI|nr:hypothetical protein B0T16DRAFT_451308 [Cercophora newfieldiana]
MSEYEDSDYEDSEDEQQIWALEALEKNAQDSFDVGLFEDGDVDSGFHTKNDPEDPFQRSKVTQRKGAVDVKCSLIDIVHGQWGPDEPGAKATLVVLLFRFDPRRRSRRIASAQLQFSFFDASKRNRLNPGVVDISLNESLSVVPTKRIDSVTTGGGASVGGGVLGAELSAQISWEKTVEQEVTDATHIVGSIDRLGATVGPDNSASWTLTENESQKSGIPAAMQVGILLKRQTDDDFTCTVKIETEVDFKTRVGQFFGKREADDPILFRTDLKPTNKLQVYDTAELGSFDVSTVEDVVFTKIRGGTIKRSHGQND